MLDIVFKGNHDPALSGSFVIHGLSGSWDAVFFPESVAKFF